VIRRASRAFVTACLLVGILAGPAFGHASLVESDPADGGSLETTPATLTAQYDEELDPNPDASRIVVRNADDEVVARGGVTPDDETVMSVELPALPPGAYRARWTARTPDDEGVTRGTITFTVESAPASAGASASAPSSAAASVRPSGTGGAATPRATARPSPSVSPTPSDAQPGAIELLLALAAAGIIAAGLVFYLMRRGSR